MNERNWRSERNNRTARYPGAAVLDPKKKIVIQGHPEYMNKYEGQVAVLTASNLLARMTPSVKIDIPNTPIVYPLPWEGCSLREVVLGNMSAADPFGDFDCIQKSGDGAILSIGPGGRGLVAHGIGWHTFVGNGSSCLKDTKGYNPIGAALAAILAVGYLSTHRLNPPKTKIYLNAFNWSPTKAPNLPVLEPEVSIGKIWTVGTGSVGTSVLYFLTLFSRNFATALFDMDTVAVHNLDRSPIFTNEQVGKRKVFATREYLDSVGVLDVRADPSALNLSELWKRRIIGTPDVLISAANEQNVRSVIESSLPPLQIYGTTGRNWQANIIRHIPNIDPCSCCLFPEKEYTPTLCATGSLNPGSAEDRDDVSLPFLSFAAGLMAACEILKLTLPGYPFSTNRVALNCYGYPRFVHAPMRRRTDCVCQSRDIDLQRKAIAGSRYEILSEPGPVQQWPRAGNE